MADQPEHQQIEQRRPDELPPREADELPDEHLHQVSGGGINRVGSD